MSGQKTSGDGRVRRWVVAALGTLILGLAGVWLKHFLGPQPPPDPCAVYKPPDADYIKEMLDQAQMDTGASDAITDVLHKSILIGHFMLWVADCGKVQRTYERDFGDRLVRVTPYAIYTNRDGDECRKLAVSQRVEGRWEGSSDVYCRVGGKWTLVTSSE